MALASLRSWGLQPNPGLFQFHVMASPVLHAGTPWPLATVWLHQLSLTMRKSPQVPCLPLHPSWLVAHVTEAAKACFLLGMEPASVLTFV